MAFKVVFLLALFCLSTRSFILASNGGFSVELIHRDSPKSPFYNPNDTPFDRLRNGIRHSIARSNYFKSSAVSTNGVQSKVVAVPGMYLMCISLGTPPVELFAIADTGSDMLWVQCQPCKQCYKQEGPIFDPSKSSTYSDVSCESDPCKVVGGGVSTCSGSQCPYSIHYGDKSFSSGNLATETLTLASTSNSLVTIPNTVFGCGHDNEGTFGEKGTGIVGLGGGPLSLITLLGSNSNGKFSYCLAPSLASSTMNFGDNAIVSGEGVVTTLLVIKDPTFYHVTLEGITVGDEKLAYRSSARTSASGVENGNIVIDNGSTMTMLPTELYNELESSIRQAINLEPIEDPSLKPCYKPEDLEVPLVTFHFTGADVVLQPMNTFTKVDENKMCLAFIPNDHQIAIFGNMAQMNFLIGYDTQAGTVSFKPTDCTKQ